MSIAMTDEKDTVQADEQGSASDFSPPAIRRTEAGRFPTGVSGNPGGRSRADLEIRDLAQSHGASAIGRLLELTQSTNERVAVAACEALLNRGFGTPRQSIDLTAAVTANPGGPVPDFATVSKDEAVRAYLALMDGSQ
jgi:hypothetical protein